MSSTFSSDFLNQSKNVTNYVNKYVDLVRDQLEKIEQIYKLIEGSKNIHIYGKGRSGSVAVCLALRLKHFGYRVSFIGDVIKEGIDDHDLAIFFSGSGETSEVVDAALKAKQIGAKIVSVTSYDQSTLARNSDVVITFPGGMEKKKGWDYLEAQLSRAESPFYGGGEFELFAYIFQETLVDSIGRYKSIPPSIVAKRHERDEVL